MVGGILSGEHFVHNCDHRRLVIVQQNELLLRALQRYLGLYCSDVRAAQGGSDAERILTDSRPLPTDLLVGDSLGPSLAVVSLLDKWRQLCPSLDRVIMLAATDDTPNFIDGIDAVFREPLEPEAISRFLWGRRPSRVATTAKAGALIVET